MSSFFPFDVIAVEQQRADARRSYWIKLRKARADFHNDTVETSHPTTGEFYYFMQRQWGIKIGLDSNQNITDTYEIVDEGKHLMFMIKYGN